MCWNIWRNYFIIRLLFVTPMPTVYSRERLLSLRSRAAVSLLSRQQCLLISHLGLRRRGCRGGQHSHRRLQAVNTRVTSSMGIPAAFVNKDQLIDGGRSTLHVLTVSLPVSLTPSPVQLRPDVTPPAVTLRASTARNFYHHCWLCLLTTTTTIT